MLNRSRVSLLLVLFFGFFATTSNSSHFATLIDGAIATESPAPPAQYNEILRIAPITRQGRTIRVAWLEWSPDATRIAIVYEDDHAIRILDAKTGKAQFSIDVPEATSQGALALVWSPDSKHLAGTFDITYGTLDGIIKIWQMEERSSRLARTIRRPGNRTSSICWSPDGTRLSSTHFSSAIESNVLSIWDAITGVLVATKDSTSIGAWSPDGKKMVGYAGKKGKLQIISTDTFQVSSEFPEKTDEPFSGRVAWAPDNNSVLGAKCRRGDLCRLWMWNIQSNRLFQNFEQDQYLSVVDLAVSPSGTLLSVLEIQSNIVDLWHIRTGKFLNPPLQMTSGFVDFIAWHPSEDMLAVANGDDGAVQVWVIELPN
jgi:WD40 repeat protein